MRFVGIGGEVGCATLIIVLIAVFGGLWLDSVLGTKPVLTLIFVLGSAPLSLALTFYIAMRQIKNINNPPPAEPKNQSKEGEKTGE
ncbi:MAG: AtpZ/AtpI family protein [Chloroflexota bacterium]